MESVLVKRYKGVSIFVDRDRNLLYETNGRLRNLRDFFLVPILNNLPVGFQRFIKRSHKSAKEVIEHATTHKALEHLYTKGASHSHRNWVQKFFHSVWFNLDNSKAVRNRLRLVEKQLKLSVERFQQTKRDIYILSIAAGSARAIIETLRQFVPRSELNFHVTFLDKDEAAIRYSQEFARRELPANRYDLSWAVDTVSNFPRYYQNQKPDIIEMVGLLDYFSHEKALQTFMLVRNTLSPGGIFIAANICDNKEREFVTRVVGWPMVYRKPEHLVDLALEAGFSVEKITVLQEPLRIHTVMILEA